MTLEPPIPVLRVFDAALAKAFYADWLGFKIDVDDVEALHRELRSRPNPNMDPGVEVAPWNAKVMDVIDPFGSRLTFNQLLAKA
jgi:uncharacterized glyoxalase superfamily protein PhnB